MRLRVLRPEDGGRNLRRMRLLRALETSLLKGHLNTNKTGGEELDNGQEKTRSTLLGKSKISSQKLGLDRTDRPTNRRPDTPRGLSSTPEKGLRIRKGSPPTSQGNKTKNRKEAILPHQRSVKGSPTFNRLRLHQGPDCVHMPKGGKNGDDAFKKPEKESRRRIEKNSSLRV